MTQWISNAINFGSQIGETQESLECCSKQSRADTAPNGQNKKVVAIPHISMHWAGDTDKTKARFTQDAQLLGKGKCKNGTCCCQLKFFIAAQICVLCEPDVNVRLACSVWKVSSQNMEGISPALLQCLVCVLWIVYRAKKTVTNVDVSFLSLMIFFSCGWWCHCGLHHNAKTFLVETISTHSAFGKKHSDPCGRVSSCFCWHLLFLARSLSLPLLTESFRCDHFLFPLEDHCHCCRCL